MTRREQSRNDRARTRSRAERARDDGGSRRRRRDDDGDDGIFVMSGRHAEAFLDRMFGSGADSDEDDDDDDDDEEDEEEDDPEPPSGNRFFRGRR